MIREKKAAEMTAEEAKRSSFGRNSLGRKLRGMKRIMGKKSTPPTSPTGSTGTAASGGGGKSPVGLAPRVGGVGPYSATLGHAHSDSGELMPAVEEGEGPSGVASQHAKGKAFLEMVGADDGGGGRGEGSGVDDSSPDATASLSAGTGGGTSISGYASPSSHESGGKEGGGGGDGVVSATASSFNAA